MKPNVEDTLGTVQLEPQPDHVSLGATAYGGAVAEVETSSSLVHRQVHSSVLRVQLASCNVLKYRLLGKSQ